MDLVRETFPIRKLYTRSDFNCIAEKSVHQTASDVSLYYVCVQIELRSNHIRIHEKKAFANAHSKPINCTATFPFLFPTSTRPTCAKLLALLRHSQATIPTSLRRRPTTAAAAATSTASTQTTSNNRRPRQHSNSVRHHVRPLQHLRRCPTPAQPPPSPPPLPHSMLLTFPVTRAARPSSIAPITRHRRRPRRHHRRRPALAASTCCPAASAQTGGSVRVCRL